VIAWVFIIFSGFSTLIGILQNIMIQTMFSSAEMNQAFAMANQDENMPFFAQFMARYFRWIFLAILLLSATTLVSAIGLLKRMNWARLLFVGIMGLGIVWNIVGFALQLTMFHSMSPALEGAPTDVQTNFQAMYIVIVVFGGIMAIGFSVLFGWIIKRLMSQSINREFGVQP
jgi:hypothetical protein